MPSSDWQSASTRPTFCSVRPAAPGSALARSSTVRAQSHASGRCLRSARSASPKEERAVARKRLPNVVPLVVVVRRGLALFEPLSRMTGLPGRSHHQAEVFAMPEPKAVELKLGPIPASCLGSDGKIRHMTEEEHRQYIESVRRRLVEIAQIPDDPNDPPDEEWMRGEANQTPTFCSQERFEFDGPFALARTSWHQSHDGVGDVTAEPRDLVPALGSPLRSGPASSEPEPTVRSGRG